MQRFLAIFLLSMCLPGFSQTLELSGGYLLNHMFDYEDDYYTHWRSDYTNGGGYGLVLALEDVSAGRARMRFSLAFEHFDGELSAYNSGLGSGSGKTAEFNKSLLSVCFFPHGFTILKKFDLHIGIQISCLLNEKFTGTTSSWSIIPYTGGSSTMEEKYDHFNSAFYAGLIARLAYNIKVAESLYIFPQYSFYFGLSPEFREFPTETRSMRHFFAIGIEKRLGKKPKSK